MARKTRAHKQRYAEKRDRKGSDPRSKGDREDSKWVFRVNQGVDGPIQRYKARLCGRRFQQQPGLDYTETFAPVVRYNSLRVLLAIVAYLDLEMTQSDIKTAFLYGELEEDLFMKIPEGLHPKLDADKVASKLNKSLYGLKQAPRCWNKRFHNFLTQFDFQECHADKCTYRGTVSKETVFLAHFVDDGLLVSESTEAINRVLDCLRESFEITISDASMYVGMQLERDRKNRRMFIHQSMYTRQIINKFGLTNAHSVSVPSDPQSTLSRADVETKVNDGVPYNEAVGSPCLFLSLVSRPDIAYAVSQVSTFNNEHNHSHGSAVRRIFRYLLGTVDCGLLYGGEDGTGKMTLCGFADADFVRDIDSRKSVTRYITLLNDSLVTWRSQRQSLVASSTTESEYVAAATASNALIWRRQLLTDLGYDQRGPTVLYMNNQSAIRLAFNPEFHKRTKHIAMKYHIIRNRVKNKQIVLKYVSTNDQLADLFTKALVRDKFVGLRDRFNVCTQRHMNGGCVE